MGSRHGNPIGAFGCGKVASEQGGAQDTGFFETGDKVDETASFAISDGH